MREPTLRRDSMTLSVLSEYFAFDVGNCVNPFLTTRPAYPRIAPGWGCR